MTLQVHCIEPDARPARGSVTLAPGGCASLYLLLGKASRNLRATVLRERDAAPPPEAVRLLDVDVALGPAGSPSGRVRALNPQVELVVFRGDVRGRVVADAEVRGPTRFEASLPDGRVLGFALDVTATARQGARQTAGSGRTRSLESSSRELRALWIVPSVWEALEDPRTRLGAAIQGRLPTFVRSRWFTTGLALATGVAFSMWYGASTRAHVADVEAQRDDAVSKATTADANLHAALSAEQSCTIERRDLAERLEDVTAERAARADAALALSDARVQAVAQGGPRMQGPDALAWDQAAARHVRDAVIGLLEPMIAAPAPKVDACLAQAALLGSDLPRYVLLWHGDRDRVCPDDYAAVRAGVDLAGRWGLSKRAAAELGAPVAAMAAPFAPNRPATVDDLRENDVWSLTAVATGLRRVEAAILRANTGDRPPVASGELHLWALALLSAYDHMPSAADGVMDQPVDACVAGVLTELAGRGGAPTPGEPVLPDIGRVATDLEVPVTPTAGCPWPDHALEDGAVDALRVVARDAWLDPAVTSATPASTASAP